MKLLLHTFFLCLLIMHLTACNDDDRLVLNAENTNNIEAINTTKTKRIDNLSAGLVNIMDFLNFNQPSEFSDSLYRLFDSITTGVSQLFQQNIPDDTIQIGNATTSIYYSEQTAAKKALIYFPGGGYRMPVTQGHIQFTNRIRSNNNIDLFITQYTLSSDAPYPAALNDALAIYNHLINELNYLPENISIGGDSSGAHLTLSLLLELKNRQQPLPAAALLFSVWADMRLTAPSINTNRDTDVLLSRENIELIISEYLAGTGITSFDNPMLSPALADLTDLPPLLLMVSAEEILLNDSQVIYTNAVKANVPVRLFIYQDPNGAHIPHAWIAISQDGELADDNIEEISDFLQRYLF